MDFEEHCNDFLRFRWSENFATFVIVSILEHEVDLIISFLDIAQSHVHFISITNQVHASKNETCSARAIKAELKALASPSELNALASPSALSSIGDESTSPPKSGPSSVDGETEAHASSNDRVSTDSSSDRGSAEDVGGELKKEKEV